MRPRSTPALRSICRADAPSKPAVEKVSSAARMSLSRVLAVPRSSGGLIAGMAGILARFRQSTEFDGQKFADCRTTCRDFDVARGTAVPEIGKCPMQLPALVRRLAA